MESLIKSLEAATGPDPSLDEQFIRQVERFIIPQVEPREDGAISLLDFSTRKMSMPVLNVTASVDQGLKVAESLGIECKLDTWHSRVTTWAQVEFATDAEAEAKTLPLALCVAILKSLQKVYPT